MKTSRKLLLFACTLCMLTLALSVSIISNAVDIKTVQLTAVSNSKNGLSVSWKKVGGVDGYIIYRQRIGSSGWKRLAKIEKASVVSYTDKSVRNGVRYTYTMKAYVGSGKSESSNRISRVYCAVPTVSSVKNISNGVYLKWKECAGADEYRIYRKSSGSEWKRIACVSPKNLSYTDSRVKSAVRYMYQIRQVCSKNISASGGNQKTMTFISAPKDLRASASVSGIQLSWKAVMGADRYYVFRKSSGEKSWKKVSEIKGNLTAWTDKSAPKGKTGYYRLRAVILSPKATSAYSSKAGAARLDKSTKMVALTFDDGPYRPVTNQILDVLQKYNSRATFFVVGSRVSTYSDCIRRAVSLGCEIGNHTYNHTTLTTASDSQIMKEISDSNDALKKYTGCKASIVRAPGGSVNSRVLSLVPYPFISWSVDTMDWSHRSVSRTVQNIKNNVRDGSIVLMHDLYYSTGDATEIIVPWLIDQGYQIVTVSEMMKYKGTGLTNGKVYYQAW